MTDLRQRLQLWKDNLTRVTEALAESFRTPASVEELGEAYYKEGKYDAYKEVILQLSLLLIEAKPKDDEHV